MKIYIAGKIFGLLNYREIFAKAEAELTAQGHIVVNPAVLQEGLGDHVVYMTICFAMLKPCDAIYMLPNWKDSKGATMELNQAQEDNKIVIFANAKVGGFLARAISEAFERVNAKLREII